MRSKLILGIVFAGMALGLIYFGASWTERGIEIERLKDQVKWQEARYDNLVKHAREVQKTLERAQKETEDWQKRYDALAAEGPVIKERVRTVTERVPEYISRPQEPVANDAEEALAKLAAYVSEQVGPMVEGDDEP